MFPFILRIRNAAGDKSYGSGALDSWVTDQIWVESVAPRESGTGNLDNWVTDQIWATEYSKA